MEDAPDSTLAHGAWASAEWELKIQVGLEAKEDPGAST